MLKQIQLGLIITATALVFFLGMLTHYKLQKPAQLTCPECPSCPSVEIQSLDIKDLKKIKGGFTFAPVYNGSVVIKQSVNDTVKGK